MLGKLISFALIGIAVFAVYKYFGGDIGAAFSAAWDVFFRIIDAGSDVVLKALGSLSGS